MSLLKDVGLTLRIKAALIADELIGPRDINVDTQEGVVTLHGTVPADALLELAAAIALAHGARQVVNELAVEGCSDEPSGASIPPDLPHVTASAGAPPTGHAPLEEAVRAALAADPRVNEHLIRVRVEDGLAYLIGRQGTVDAREAATEVAAHVPGIMGVNNDLEVIPAV
jgi:hyperosmotically inducible periplasmic protein